MRKKQIKEKQMAIILVLKIKLKIKKKKGRKVLNIPSVIFKNSIRLLENYEGKYYEEKRREGKKT